MGGVIPEGVFLPCFGHELCFSSNGVRDGCQRRHTPRACTKSLWTGARARAGLFGQGRQGGFASHSW